MICRDEHLGITTTDRRTEHFKEEEEEGEEEPVDTSQGHDAYVTLATGSDHELWASADRTVLDEEQQIQRSSSHGSPVASVGTLIHEQNEVSKTSLQAYTESEQSAVVTTTEKYNVTGIERDQFDQVVWYVVRCNGSGFPVTCI